MLRKVIELQVKVVVDAGTPDKEIQDFTNQFFTNQCDCYESDATIISSRDNVDMGGLDVQN